ncbi:unnamed protein product, partial [Effrenium voratum]
MGSPGWLKSDFPKIRELAAPYSSCTYCQYGPSLWEDETQNEPLKALRAQFRQYTFTFRSEWCGFGRSANWQHVLKITNNDSAAGEIIGDLYVVNAIASHPFDLCVATSGIDNSVKIWMPSRREEPMPLDLAEFPW